MLGKVVRYLKSRLVGEGLVANVNRTSHARNCLLLYITEPFRENAAPNVHQNRWQVRKLAEIVGEFGYNVDVVNFNERKARLTKSYDLVIDLHPRADSLYRHHLAPGARKIAYITGSNPAFSNQAEKARLEAVRQRRGVTLKPRRQAAPFEPAVLESFDSVFFIGSDFNLGTYAPMRFQRVAFIRNTGYDSLAPDEAPERDARSIMFLASSGQVHKGLDLLLEVCAADPDLTLYVCSRFEAERDFVEAYRHELYDLPNVRPVGFLDVMGAEFRALTARCSYVVLPSCSEANAGSVLTGMSAGLIPLVSRECGFSADEVHYFPDCRMETLARTLREFGDRPASWREAESRRAMATVRDRYSPEAYEASVRAGLEEVLMPEGSAR